MKSYFIDKKTSVDLSALRSNWGFEQFGVKGDYILSCVGPSQTKDAHTVLHIVAEHFVGTHREAIFSQRMLEMGVRTRLKECLDEMSGPSVYFDDFIFQFHLFEDVVSNVIYLGLNVDLDLSSEHSMALGEFDIDSRPFAIAVMQRYMDDLKSVNEQYRMTMFGHV